MTDQTSKLQVSSNEARKSSLKSLVSLNLLPAPEAADSLWDSGLRAATPTRTHPLHFVLRALADTPTLCDPQWLLRSSSRGPTPWNMTSDWDIESSESFRRSNRGTRRRDQSADKSRDLRHVLVPGSVSSPPGIDLSDLPDIWAARHAAGTEAPHAAGTEVPHAAGIEAPHAAGVDAPHAAGIEARRVDMAAPYAATDEPSIHFGPSWLQPWLRHPSPARSLSCGRYPCLSSGEICLSGPLPMPTLSAR